MYYTSVYSVNDLLSLTGDLSIIAKALIGEIPLDSKLCWSIKSTNLEKCPSYSMSHYHLVHAVFTLDFQSKFEYFQLQDLKIIPGIVSYLSLDCFVYNYFPSVSSTSPKRHGAFKLPLDSETKSRSPRKMERLRKTLSLQLSRHTSPKDFGVSMSAEHRPKSLSLSPRR